MESLSISYKEFIFYIIWLLNVFAINMQCASIGLIKFDILILSEARQVIPETYDVMHPFTFCESLIIVCIPAWLNM